MIKLFQGVTSIVGIFLLGSIPILLVSCSDSDKSISLGSDFIQSDTRLIRIDTFELEMSSMIFDSLPSSGNKVALCGNNVDSQFGRVYARSNIEFTYPSAFEISTYSVYDSTFLILTYNTYSFGDTTKAFTLEAYRLEENIDPGDNDYMYTTSQLSWNPLPLGSQTFYPKPNGTDSIAIRLSDFLGKELFNDLAYQTRYGYAMDDIADYFKGIMIRSMNDEASSILGFKVSGSDPRIRIYYHEIGQSEVDHHIEFPAAGIDLQFNQIVSDRTGTLIENLKSQANDIRSTETGNKCFLQCGAGIMTKIRFPSLDQLLLMQNEGVFLKAVLEVSPSKESYLKKNLPGSLVLFDTDKYNRLGVQVVDANNTYVTAKLVPDYQYDENLVYRFDISNFLKLELKDNYFDPEHGLLLTYPAADVYSRTDNMQIETDPKTGSAPKLLVYYVYY